MRNRPEETMLMIVRCAPALAIAVGLIFALETVPAVRAQVTVDVSKITCDQFNGYKVTNPKNIAIWLSGYYHGERGETTVDTQQLAGYAKNCANPAMSRGKLCSLNSDRQKKSSTVCPRSRQS